MMRAAGLIDMDALLPGDGVAVPSKPAARTRAATAAKPAGLHPGEVMWFDNGFSVELKDSARKPATEAIVDPRTGEVCTEPGPAVMWNTSFGMHAGSQGANTHGVASGMTSVNSSSGAVCYHTWHGAFIARQDC